MVTEAEEIQVAMLCVVISIFCSTCSMGYIWTVDISLSSSVVELLTKVVRGLVFNSRSSHYENFIVPMLIPLVPMDYCLKGVCDNTIYYRRK